MENPFICLFFLEKIDYERLHVKLAGKFEYFFLQFSSSSQIGQHLDHVIGHGRSYGQVSTGRLESVLISHPINFDDGAISFDVRVAATHHGADTFRILRVDLLLRSALRAFDAIFRLETEKFLK
jgi:hypothetical protein